jgi:hypothetical protein
LSQHIPATIYLDMKVIIGMITLPDKVRLSDFLNAPEKFFKITEASTSDGVIERFKDILINKEAIKFIKTATGNDGRGLGSDYYLHVKKVPVRIKMFTTDYELNGFLYNKNAGDIANLFDRETMFLPCTEVKVRHINSNTISDAGFAAINRNKVCTIQPEESSLTYA